MSDFTAAELSAFRDDFPILNRIGRGGRQIAYLDSAATAQKPNRVIEAEKTFYQRYNGAVNRGTHLLADDATTAYEEARLALAKFVGAQEDQIIWTRNATEALNLVANSFLDSTAFGGPQCFTLKEGDEICVTRAEHHANMVPWQEVCKRTGAILTWLDLTPDGRIDLDTLDRIGPRTKVVSFTHASNVTGAISPVEQIVSRARQFDALVVLDTCQSAAHLPIEVKKLAVDFAVFSAHKMFGPTGIGALYGRSELLKQMTPLNTGGSMVADVTMEGAIFQDPPARFEAGTQAVAQCAAWHAALDYINVVGMDRMVAHEEAICQVLLDGFKTLNGVRVLGPTDTKDRLALVAFEIEGIHPHDIGQVLDSYDVAVRVGHHCAIPLHRHFGVRASARASASFTTTVEEIDRLIVGIREVQRFFGRA